MGEHGAESADSSACFGWSRGSQASGGDPQEKSTGGSYSTASALGYGRITGAGNDDGEPVRGPRQGAGGSQGNGIAVCSFQKLLAHVWAYDRGTEQMVFLLAG
ncbi:hypothetical protein D3C85_1614810 [compost metagenome]